MNKVLYEIKKQALQKKPKMSFWKHLISVLGGAAFGASVGFFAAVAGLIPLKLAVNVDIPINFIKIFPCITGLILSYIFWKMVKEENKLLKYILSQQEINDYLLSINDKRLQEKTLNKISDLLSSENNSLSLLKTLEIHEEIIKYENTAEKENKRLEIEKCLRNELKQTVGNFNNESNIF